MNHLIQEAGIFAPAIIDPLRPRGNSWVRVNYKHPSREPSETWYHPGSGSLVISAVEVIDPKKGAEYHISVSRQVNQTPTRADSNLSQWVLKQFCLEGSEEDNHVPNGIARNFWRYVADPLVGVECECKATEAAIVEDKGDYIWRSTGGA